MAVNSYFNQYSHVGQQDLLESLIIESIRIYGFNMLYLPRENASFDDIFRESDVNIFRETYTIETYLKSTEGFTGDQKFMSVNLGFEIRDQVTFTMPHKTFKNVTKRNRPNEGDLIFLPLDKKLYEIKYVNHQAIFYQLGKLNTWDLTCELLEYNGQIFKTGNPDIDKINTDYNLDDVEDNQIEDWLDQSNEFQAITPDIIDFDEKDPFGMGGTF